ncbi:MAG: PIN domain-containing protein [Nevskiales bacterium]
MLAFLRNEPAAEQVQALLEKAAQRDVPLLMTEVNYAEVKYITLRKEGEARWRAAADALVSLPIEFHPVDRALADGAADIKARFALSLADAFAAALAKQKTAELVTGDSEFKPLEGGIKIHWLQK